ncbi:MAG TPA: hypothetical protein VGJ20_30390 [Xanthobacteraceae bacterium]
MQRLRDRAAGNVSDDTAALKARIAKLERQLAASGNNVSNEFDFAAWWQGETASYRSSVLDEIGLGGDDGILTALQHSSEWQDWLQERAIEEAEEWLEHCADEHGYWKIPDWIEAHQFEEFLTAHGYEEWVEATQQRVADNLARSPFFNPKVRDDK